MDIALRTTTFLCAAAVAAAMVCPSVAGRQQRPSARISAFGDETTAPAPSPSPVAAPAAKPVRFGAVVPPPPVVAVAGHARPGATGRFSARPAAASKLAVNSPFGLRSDPLTGVTRMHTGVDLRADYGSSVGASMSGKIWFAGVRSGYGNLVVIDHGNGVATFYAHLSAITVGTGEAVEAGQLVGLVGSTGRSTGPHLHYEVRANGHPVDPSSRISIVGDEVVVEGRAFGRSGTWDGPVELPRAPGGTTISVNLSENSGQMLVVDLE